MNNSSEEPLYFSVAPGQALFGVLHHSKPNPSVACVICNAFGEEKQLGYRPLVKFAREFAGAGIPTLRFDYRGTGDSDCDSVETTVDTQSADLRCAVNLAVDRFGVDSIVVLGIRFGSVSAVRVAGADPRVIGLVLVSPIVSGKRYWNELVRKQKFAAITLGVPALSEQDLQEQLREKGATEVEAQLVSAEMVEQMCRVDLVSDAVGNRRPILITGLASDGPGQQDCERLAAAAADSGGEAQTWYEQDRDFWSGRSMYDAYVPDSIIRKITSWIQTHS